MNCSTDNYTPVDSAVYTIDLSQNVIRNNQHNHICSWHVELSSVMITPCKTKIMTINDFNVMHGCKASALYHREFKSIIYIINA
jgi:hypothetical protein